MMRQLRWGLKAEFPYTKVFFLGILLAVLGSACVIVSVVGIVQLAWGYYVSTGMWGGVTITVSGLAAMYAARAQSSFSARLYFFLSIVTCLVSFAMVVLSAGGLTYRSKFYHPMRIDSSRHRVTLFLHGSVLGVGVVSLACNLLSVIVCCKFITKEKSRGEETFKLRRYRHRFSDVNTAYRGSSRGSQGTVRTSTNSRTPLFGSDRSHKYSRRTSETDSTNLKIPGERVSNRRDSDRSKGSSRSRHSHHRQSSSVSQQSRQSAPMDAEVTTVLLRDTDHNHMEITSSHSTIDNARDSQAETMTDNMSVQLVFDPDEEPPPPYEEARPLTLISSDGNESETEAVDDSSNVVIPSCLPLNIPVTRIRACQMQSLQSQPPPMEPSSNQVCEYSQQNSEQCSAEVAGASVRTVTDSHKPADASTTERDNRINMARMTLADQWPNAAASAAQSSALQNRDSSDVVHSEDGSASPEICALTGERMTPVAAVQPDSVAASNSAALVSCVSQHNPSPDSSDSSVPGELVKISHNPAPSHPPSGTAYAVSSESSSALPAGIHSPSSAFRPVGKRIVPLAHASPSNSVPLHNVFSPISSPGSAHHTVYSPIASPSSAARFASPTSPHRTKNMASSSSESLTRGSCVQSLSWKKVPLPSSHNHSNRTSSVPFKEVVSKTIPGPSQPPPREKDTLPHSLPKRGSKDKERGFSKNSDNKALRNQLTGNGLESDILHKQESKFSSPVRRPPQRAQPASEQHTGPSPADDSHLTEQGNRSAFVSKQPGNVGRPPISANIYPAATGKQVPVSVVNSQPAFGKQVPVSVVESHAAGRNKLLDGNNIHPSNTRGHSNKAGPQTAPAMGSNHSAGIVNFPPVSSQPGQHSSVTNKQSAVHASPSKVVRDQTAGMDANCRSTGCQATDDGGIASSMDRTHRWVMGTLPSGTRFQGTTKNTILIHGNSRNTTLTQGARNNPLMIHAASRNPALAQGGARNAAFPQGSTRNSAVTQSPTRNPVLGVNSSPERSALLAPVARHGNGKTHGVWSRPSKTALNTMAGGGEAAAVPVSSTAVCMPVSSLVANASMPCPSVTASGSSPSAAASMSSPSVAASMSSPLVNTSPSSPSVSASQSTSSVSASEPLGMPLSALADVGGPQAVPQRGGGASSSRLPRYLAARQADGQAMLPQPLQPVPVIQPHRPLPQHPQQPLADRQHQHAVRQLGDGEQDLDQQQGKPLFSVLL